MPYYFVPDAMDADFDSKLALEPRMSDPMDNLDNFSPMPIYSVPQYAPLSTGSEYIANYPGMTPNAVLPPYDSVDLPPVAYQDVYQRAAVQMYSTPYAYPDPEPNLDVVSADSSTTPSDECLGGCFEPSPYESGFSQSPVMTMRAPAVGEPVMATFTGQEESLVDKWTGLSTPAKIGLGLLGLYLLGAFRR